MCRYSKCEEIGEGERKREKGRSCVACVWVSALRGVWTSGLVWSREKGRQAGREGSVINEKLGA